MSSEEYDVNMAKVYELGFEKGALRIISGAFTKDDVPEKGSELYLKLMVDMNDAEGRLNTLKEYFDKNDSFIPDPYPRLLEEALMDINKLKGLFD